MAEDHNDPAAARRTASGIVAHANLHSQIRVLRNQK
jgi:hypothetical protein